MTAMSEKELFRYATPLVGGEFMASTSLGRHSHIDPSTGRPQAEFQLAGAAEVNAAVAAALDGFRAWQAIGPEARRDILFRWTHLIERDSELLTVMTAREHGAPRMIPMVQLALSWMRYYAGWADKIEGTTVEVPGGPAHAYTRHEAYGVVGIIIPWNGPLVSSGMKVFPALAAGNAVILKPPALAPFIALRLGALALEAGMPAGVLNVVPGEVEAGQALVRHRDVAKISFTGGEGVARKVAEMAAEQMKPVAFELGGKSANIIFEDADLDSAAQMTTFLPTAGNAGQGCCLPTRAYVQDSVYDAFMERVAAVAGHVKLGMPLEPDTMCGPVINEAACERILGVIERAKDEGARLVAGGSRAGGELAGGYFLQPTVFGDVDHTSNLAREEVFGPVLAVARFSDEDDALAKANDSRFGLGAYCHTNDLRRAHRVAAGLKAGVIGVNSGFPMSPGLPFGGYRESGYGREGGRPGLDEFLQIKSVYIPLGKGFMAE